MVFPYAVFYLQTVRKFEVKYEKSQKLEEKIKTFNESIDLDKLIAEEEFKLEFQYEKTQNISHRVRRR
jgi:hypothetical protein